MQQGGNQCGNEVRYWARDSCEGFCLPQAETGPAQLRGCNRRYLSSRDRRWALKCSPESLGNIFRAHREQPPVALSSAIIPFVLALAAVVYLPAKYYGP